jgi:putative hydrolase of the HAD superfamily
MPQETPSTGPPGVDPFDPNSYKAPAIMTGGTAPVVNEVKLLVFDMGHVFVDFVWEEVCNGFCTRSGKTRDEFRKVLTHVGGLGYETGTISTADFLSELNKQLGSDISLDEFKVLWNHGFQENVEMAALLQALGQTLPLYLLSNTNEVHYRHLQDTYNVARHFKELILSYEVGYSKPDARIYHEVLRRSGVPAQHCLFVDDLPHNVQAAQTVGMQAIQFIGIDDLKQRLNALGITC